MKDKQDIGEHVMKYLTENGTDEITDPVLINWLADDESNKEKLDRYKKIWKESCLYMNADMFDADFAWEKINGINLRKKRTGRRMRNIRYIASGIAASLLLVLGLSVLGLLGGKPEVWVSISTENGSRSGIVLPDGSVVKLNSGSNVTYSFDSKKNIREVQFQGEGFFDVAKSEIPFVVHVDGGLKVNVVGTSFNLRAYENDQTVLASLVSGRIELDHTNNQLLLEAGEMAEFDKSTNELKAVEGTLSHSYGWLENKLYMNDMPLSDVCKYLERWYNVNITIQQELGERIYYNGVIQEETIIDVMEALSYLSDIKYQVKGRNVSITSK